METLWYGTWSNEAGRQRSLILNGKDDSLPERQRAILDLVKDSFLKRNPGLPEGTVVAFYSQADGLLSFRGQFVVVAVSTRYLQSVVM